MKDIKLTQIVKSAGCAGKLPPKFLSEAIHGRGYVEEPPKRTNLRLFN